MMRIGMPPRRRSTVDFTNLNDVAASIPSSRETAPYHEISHMMTRRSTEKYSSSLSSFLAGRRQLFEPDDFSDVFGGPPRSVLSSEYDRSSSPAPGQCSSFYGEIFQATEAARKAAGWGGGRSLLTFRIPAARGDGFYNEVFGVEEVASRRRLRERSRPGSKAKSDSSSV